MRSFGRYQNNKYLLIEKSIPKLLASRHTQIARHLKIEMLLLSFSLSLSLSNRQKVELQQILTSISQCWGNFKQNELGLIKGYGPGQQLEMLSVREASLSFQMSVEKMWYLTASLRCTQCFSDQLLKKAD